MGFDLTGCAACGFVGEVFDHPLVFSVHGREALPSVFLCGPCRAVVTKRQPDRARTPAKPARALSRPPNDDLSPQVDAVGSLPRLDGA